MPPLPYFGYYGRFETREKGHVALLLGADTLVGDKLVCTPEHGAGGTVVQVDNRFGGRVGQLDGPTAEVVQLNLARGWDVHVLLASVFHVQGSEDVAYWGEVVVLAYAKNKAEVFDVFKDKVAERLAAGVRPEVDLQQASVDQLLAAGGNWLPTGRHAVFKQDGQVCVKDRRSFNENLVEQARANNPGCLVVGWAFIALLVVGALWLLKGLLGL